MLLAIDIGNTNIVFGVHTGTEWQKIWRIQTDRYKTADEYEVIFRSLFSGNKVCKTDIGKIVLSSVVPSLNREFNDMLQHFIGLKPHLLSPDIFELLPLQILNPYEIGSDLVANAMAAYHRHQNNCMVIDFGTALTFTTISADGTIAGVAIAPGLRTAIRALSGNTARLPDVPLELPPSVLGKNTVHAIQAGIVLGYTGLIDRLIERTEEELQQPVTVVATGGLSQLLAQHIKHIHETDMNLTLEGLKLIGDYV